MPLSQRKAVTFEQPSALLGTGGRLDARLGAGDRGRPAARGLAELGPGASRFVTDALVAARKAGASGVLVPRADSACYGHDVIAAALRQDARFSLTARQDKAVRKVIASMGEYAWTTITYPNAALDEQQQR